MIRARVIVISLITIVILSVWTIYSEHFVGSINSISPPPGAIFLFFLIVFGNSLLRSRWPGLRQSELVVVYSLLLVSAPISAFAVSRFFVSILVAPFHFATPENEYQALFHNIIPPWFAPRASNIVKGYYEPLGRGVPWGAWLRPLSIWLVFIMVVYVLLLCMSIIIHRQWIDRERLTFPTIFLPLQLSDEPEKGFLFNSFLKNRLLWIGFAIPALIHGINGLSLYHPVVPNIPLRVNFSRFLTDTPWNAVDQLPINFHPNVIGFTYLLPVEISFSCWFFYILSKLEMVVGAVFGWRTKASGGGSFPFAHYQSAGAFIALMLINLWFARRHIASSFSIAFRMERSPSVMKQTQADRDMARLYRFAFLGFAIAFSALLVWFLYFGINPVVAIAFLILFLIYSLSAGRVRTEAGLGAVSGPIRMDDLLRTAVGTRRMGTKSLVVLSYLRWMTVDLRGIMSSVPAQLESLKMAGSSSKTRKQMPMLILFAVALALPISCILLLRVSYKSGANTSIINGWWIFAGPRETFGILRRSILNPQGTNWTGVEYTSIGFAVTCILAYLRTKFLWFPFHPIGYAAGFSRMSMDWVWFSTAIGWGLKLLVIRYGGVKLNRKLIPLFLGFTWWPAKI